MWFNQQPKQDLGGRGGWGGGDLCHAVSQNKQLGIAKIEVIRSHAGKLAIVAQQEIHTMVKV